MNIIAGTIYGRGESIVQNRIAVAGPSLPSNLALRSNLVHLATAKSGSGVEASDGRPGKSINYLPGLLIIREEVLVSDADI